MTCCFMISSGMRAGIIHYGIQIAGELLTHSEKGYAMPYNEKAIVNTPVSLIRNNKAYTLLSADKLAQYGLASEEDDSNPTLLCVDLGN